MGLADVLSEIGSEKKEKGKATVKYVSFQIKEWNDMEAKYGKKIDPSDVKNIVLGIFNGRFDVVAKKKA